MSKLNLDINKIAKARKFALDIAENTQDFIEQHTTVTVERTVARLLGIDGVDEFGVPFPNVVVDFIKKNGDLSYGVSIYLATLLKNLNVDLQEIVVLISNNKIKLDDYTLVSKKETTTILKPYIENSLLQIKENKSLRENYLLKYGDKEGPLLYVIVATGNIYEDVTQAKAAAKAGADVVAVIRTTGQSLLDFVPYGPTTEGFGGTYATQENFRIMRKALDEVGEEESRYIRLVNYASGLCMPEIAAMGALERLDMMLNDSLYGILFRDINMQRTFVDQYFSRVINAYSGIIINTGEDNYLTTSDAVTEAHTVLASQFINEQFALLAHMKEELQGLGHAFEIDPEVENGFLLEMSQALMAREIFPNAPLKYMPPTKHMTGDIFMGTVQNALFNIAAVTSNQSIHLLGMKTEAIHTPFISDRAIALDNASYIEKAFKDFGNEITYNPNGIIVNRAKEVLRNTEGLLTQIENDGMFQTLEKGVFAGISRTQLGGKGLAGVFEKHNDYQNPILDFFTQSLKGVHHAK